MFIHPLGSSQSKITNVDDQCIQPNAIDIRLDKLFVNNRTKGYAPRILLDKTIHMTFDPVEPQGDTVYHYGNCDENADYNPKNPIFILQPNRVYQFESLHDVEIADGELGYIVARSSLVRNGLIVTSGIFDCGFRGRLGGVIHNLSGWPVIIEQNARIGQLVIARSENIKKYDGQYQDKGVVIVKQTPGHFTNTGVMGSYKDGKPIC